MAATRTLGAKKAGFSTSYTLAMSRAPFSHDTDALTGDLVSIGVEGKRPFGNSSVYWDMARILGWKMEDDDPSEKQCERLERLMKELPLAVNSIIRKL